MTTYPDDDGARASADTHLLATRNDLPTSDRAEIVELLNQRLADCIDLQTQCKQAHWNVKGPQFISLHKLFDDISEGVAGYADLIAERIVQLGGTAEGTAAIVAQRSTLDVYPLVLTDGGEHVAALADALAAFARTVRMGIEEMVDLVDAGSADILTEISRGVDKSLWFVEAHAQRPIERHHAGAPAVQSQDGRRRAPIGKRRASR